MDLQHLTKEIKVCNQCTRLRDWCVNAKGRKPSFKYEEYWAKPVPGFGDPNGRLLIIGLAPGQHGANRTGRPFTGDKAGDWLYSALYRFGFSNKLISEHRHDGLELTDAYITNVVKCAPPKDKPESSEFEACTPYLLRELELLKNVQVVLTLGEKSFNRFKSALKNKGIQTRGLTFIHGKTYELGKGMPLLLTSYHCSQRNTNRGLLTKDMWDEIFITIRSYLER